MHYGLKIHRSLYYNSPAIIRNIMASFYGRRQRGERYGEDYESEFNFLKESQYYSNERLKSYQWEKTKAFVATAVQHIRFYEKNESYKSNLSGLSQENLNSFPILSKEEVKNNISDICYPDLTKIPHRWTHTSGTTGKALVFPLSKHCFQREYAFRALHYSWGDVSLDQKDKIAFCAGHPVAEPDRKSPPFWVYDYVNKQLFFSSYHLSEENLKLYIKELELFHPKMVSGYPSSVYLLALAYKKYGQGSLKLSSVYTASETLLDYQRKTIEDAFQCRVFMWYGNSEMCANIVECERRELHLKLEHSFVEIFDHSDHPVEPGKTGRLVCTGFGNMAFPLIRYDIGDEVSLSENQKSKCGRGGLLIDKVIGRIEDYILTPDGRYIGRLDHLFKDALNVKEAQIIQNSIDEIIIKIIPRDGYSKKDEVIIKKEARLRLGTGIKLLFDYVQTIERSSNGKFRFIVSNLKRRIS